ncbi:uncharacterized protein LTR77_004213 [Saxophila tyrrhenica]|uniref:SAP domain-containing protein n=1 Tax=Saxophila tyrrhenica TaxID=1690608 RepID=A0AAV9PEM6_9PEZI|nr:hypothetical protein LTR77_004213 [Saxophila tyrrhenica]
MAAPRATQFIALRNLSRGAQQVRNLHMTGPATYASSILTQERSVTNFPRDIAGLRAECKRRKIEAAGSKQDLLARLQADELTHSRAFSTATQTRPTPAQPSSNSPPTTRHFNTSRTLKAVNDASTIDFAYLPQTALSETISASTYDQPHRVPILPDNASAAPTYTEINSAAEAEEHEVMRPTISTMSADSVFLPMSDLHDGHGLDVDFHAMSDKVAAGLRRLDVGLVGSEGEERVGMMRRVFGDMVDDVVKAVDGGVRRVA